MPVPVISVAQMREWEKASWLAGKTEAAVIAQVGGIVAARVLELTRPGDRVLLLAGKGHNGDDVRQAMPHLADRNARLCSIVDPAEFSMELLEESPALVVDGLFGIGLNRTLDAGWRRLIGRINDSGCPVLSVDSPSGINVEKGTVEGSAIQATVTLTLGAAKLGLFAPTVQSYVGRLEVAPEIGLIPCPHSSELQWTLASDFKGYPPRRPVTGHKGTFGHLGIVAGSLGYHGAAVLAVRGAQRARPGLVTVYPQGNVYLPVASQIQSAMVRPCEAALPQDCHTAYLAGPGMAAPDVSPAIQQWTGRLWVTARQPVVVDATALEWLPAFQDYPANAIRVITPHPGEAARLLKKTVVEVQSDRPAAVRALSSQYGGCWVVLKGHQTLVGRAEGMICINSTGNSGLGQGGSGDLLAGYLAGMLTQTALQVDAFRTIRHAVWQHGMTADVLETVRTNWTIEDMAGLLGDARVSSCAGQ